MHRRRNSQPSRFSPSTKDRASSCATRASGGRWGVRRHCWKTEHSSCSREPSGSASRLSVASGEYIHSSDTKRSRQQTSAPQICRLPLHLQFTFPRSRLAKRNRVRIYVRVCVRICGGRLCAYVAWNPHSYFGTVVIIGATVAVVLALVTVL